MNIDSDDVRRAPKVLLHDHLDGGLRPRTIVELAAESGYDGLPTTDPDELRRPHLPRGQPQRPGPLPRDLRAHRRGDADARGARAGGGRVRRGPRRRRRGLRRDPLRAGAAHRAGPHPRRGGRGRARRLRARLGRHAADHPRALLGHAPAGASAGDRRAGAAPPRRGRVRLRHRRPRGRATRRPATSTRSRGSCATTSTSRSTPARPSGCPRSPRPSTSAAPSASATGCGSSTTSTVDADGDHRLGRLAAFVRDRRVPLELCPSSNVHVGRGPVDRRPPDRAADRAALPGDGEHRQPADERHHA